MSEPRELSVSIDVIALLSALDQTQSPVLITVSEVECPNFRFFAQGGAHFVPWCVRKNKKKGGECVPDPTNCSWRIMGGRTVQRAIDMIASDRIERIKLQKERKNERLELLRQFRRGE